MVRLTTTRVDLPKRGPQLGRLRPPTSSNARSLGRVDHDFKVTQDSQKIWFYLYVYVPTS